MGHFGFDLCSQLLIRLMGISQRGAICIGFLIVLFSTHVLLVQGDSGCLELGKCEFIPFFPY